MQVMLKIANQIICIAIMLAKEPYTVLYKLSEVQCSYIDLLLHYSSTEQIMSVLDVSCAYTKTSSKKLHGIIKYSKS